MAQNLLQTRASPRAAPRGTAPREAPSLDIPDLFVELSRLVAQIPAGRVTTYGWLAEACGDVHAARWIAACLLDPSRPFELPCHRVVLRDGLLGQFYTGHASDKAALLADEGVVVAENWVDLARDGFRSFVSSRPLAQLQLCQAELARRVSLQAPTRIPALVAGVDVSYARASAAMPTEAVAMYALVQVGFGDLVWSHKVRQPVRFPYIPGYLTFRELPILLELLRQVRERRRLARVVLVDGNGLLHHRQAGIATHLGIVADVATIGIGKSLLCGSVDAAGLEETGESPVRYNGEILATAIRPRAGQPPIYVSPGHRVDVPFAARLVRRLLRGRRVPEPIHLAHTLGRMAAASRH